MDGDYLQEQLRLRRAELDYSLKEGSMDRPSYNRALAELAASFSLYGFIEECLQTLLDLPVNYFVDDGYELIKTDNEFAEKCELIFDTLAFFGLAGYNIDATQNQGKA